MWNPGNLLMTSTVLMRRKVKTKLIYNNTCLISNFLVSSCRGIFGSNWWWQTYFVVCSLCYLFDKLIIIFRLLSLNLSHFLLVSFMTSCGVPPNYLQAIKPLIPYDIGKLLEAIDHSLTVSMVCSYTHLPIIPAWLFNYVLQYVFFQMQCTCDIVLWFFLASLHYTNIPSPCILLNIYEFLVL